MKNLFCFLPLIAALFFATGCEDENKKTSAITSPIGFFEFSAMADAEGPVAYPNHILDEYDDFWMRRFIEITESRVRLYYIEYDFADGSPDGVGYSTAEDSTIIEITDTQIRTSREVIHYVIEGTEITFYVVTNGDTDIDTVIKAQAGNPEAIAGANEWYSIRTIKIHNR